MPKLIVEIGEDKGKVYEFKESVIIGRAKTNSICINDPEASRQHSQITQEPDGFYITDLKSRNGTKVNGQMITRCKLRRFDLITIGKTNFRFDDTDLATEQKTPASSPLMPAKGKISPLPPAKPITSPEVKKMIKNLQISASKPMKDIETTSTEPSIFSRLVFFLFLVVFFVALLLLSNWVGKLLISHWAKSQDTQTKETQP